MSAVPIQRDWAKGEMATAAEVNTNMDAPITFYRQRPMCYVSFANSVSVASSGSFNDIVWGLVDQVVDSEDMLAPPSSHIVCVRPGLYSVQGQILWGANVNGVRALKFAIVRASSGIFSTIQQSGAASSSSASYLHSGMTNHETAVRVHDPGVYMDAGDYIIFQYLQNSGSSISLLGDTNFGLTWAMVRWVASS